jgi:hypothetical protein
VLRAIEVIGMGMRDLITRVFPEQVKERFLTTSNGKVLNEKSEYVLVEEVH